MMEESEQEKITIQEPKKECEREKRVEGFGMLFSGIKPRVNIDSYYI